MKVFLGIDLGSTTSKAIIVDADGHIIGRGITNTRSDYAVAARIAQTEAEFSSRFTLLKRAVADRSPNELDWDTVFDSLENRFHNLQFELRFDDLIEAMLANEASVPDASLRSRMMAALPGVAAEVKAIVRERFLNDEIGDLAILPRSVQRCVYERTRAIPSRSIR